MLLLLLLAGLLSLLFCIALRLSFGTIKQLSQFVENFSVLPLRVGKLEALEKKNYGDFTTDSGILNNAELAKEEVQPHTEAFTAKVQPEPKVAKKKIREVSVFYIRE